MILRSLKTPLLFIVLCLVFTTCKSRRVDDDSHFNDDDEDHFLGIDSEDGHEDEEPLPPLALPLQNDVVGNKGAAGIRVAVGASVKRTLWEMPSALATSTARKGRSPCARLCLKKRILETTTTDVETSAEDVSTSNTPVTTLGTTDRRTDDPSSWTNIPQPEPRTVAPSVPLSTVLPLTTMMTQTSDVDSELPPQRECSQQDYDFMKENLLLFNSAKLTDSKKPGNEYLVSIMFSHYDQNNNGQLEAEELWQAAERDHLGQLSKSCILADMLLFDDTDRDGAMSINEFYLAFSVSVVSLDKALEVNHVTARVGDNVEIKCDVTGTPPPPIVWRRNDMDLASLNEDEIKVFVDGSLYLTNVQLIHGGNYTCHAQHNRDVVQTHILHVHTIPEVHVIPKLQSRAPGELAEMECHVIGVPTPAVSWLKNDEELKLMTDKYTIVGEYSTPHSHTTVTNALEEL
ncbi:Follistatin-related protein 5 like protein [Argiope bruennichi]|uniref:Follistatin-related protein 5 like protein n=1 Tax=Argiope bruennichi TaxID=94029 RepID=A0A8T0EV71_ARGBR|nr:Follistatin-related protein 5 like protein [Argiope bruennichi]